MNEIVTPDSLAEALSSQLKDYRDDVVATVNMRCEKAVKRLVQITKSTAPKRSGRYRKAITYTTETNPATGSKTYTWGARAPHHRLTHLLVNGHEAQAGGRVDGDPFLENALNEVLPECEREVEEALGDD